MTPQEYRAVNTLLGEYVKMLCLRERVCMQPLADFSKLLYEVEMELDEIKLILNTFLLDSGADL